ncbi:hypothetical protein [Neolewinella agarilytica]|uniref:Flavodoxin-like domain-containing protein n=1 Tax=Neolewinella agarilytica TaxID=478744 RepID=A0A1H9KYI5_9BACT|nr:hypothetical protein [Neolewinella agarilytica]SER03937.1 hypothetical protein SAMN05444359_12238 [Neolewinella agarilytica]
MKFRKSTKVGLALLLLFTSFFVWYLGTYSMAVATSFEVNSPSAPKHLLIVTQQSTHKDSLTAGIITAFTERAVYIKVIDITAAVAYQTERKIDACILMHTWEFWRPPGMVNDFKESLPEDVPLFVISTSGSGEMLLDEEVDGISSASDTADLEWEINTAVSWARLALGLVSNTITLEE